MTLRTRFLAGLVVALATVGTGSTIGLAIANGEIRDQSRAAVVPNLTGPPVPASDPAPPAKTGDKSAATPKADPPKTETPKTETPKADPPTGDAAKTEPAPPPKAGAAPLLLPPTLVVEAADLFTVVTAQTDADDVYWIVVASVPLKYEAIGAKLVLGTPKDAVIHVYAYATVGGRATPPSRLVVTVKAAPGPPPAPGPQPPPAPGPDDPPAIGGGAGKVYVTLVEDPALRIDNPWVAEIINNKPLREAFAKAGYTFRVLSVKDPEYQRAKFAPYVEAAGGLPALVVQDGKGKVYDPQKLPQTPAAVKEAVEKAVAKSKE